MSRKEDAVSSREEAAAPVCLALTGRRILVTRAPGQASQLAERLSALGATPILIPTIEIAPPASFAALDAALAALSGFDLVAFTSANAVEAFRQRAQLLGRHARAAPHRGGWPCNRARGCGDRPACRSRSTHIYRLNRWPKPLCRPCCPKRPVRASCWCWPSRRPRRSPPRWQPPELASPSPRRTATASPGPRWQLSPTSSPTPRRCPDAVTFTSASTAGNLIALLDAAGLTLPAAVVRASIGPVTSRALADLGLPPHLEAGEPTIAALAEALAGYFHAASRQKLY